MSTSEPVEFSDFMKKMRDAIITSDEQILRNMATISAMPELDDDLRQALLAMYAGKLSPVKSSFDTVLDAYGHAVIHEYIKENTSRYPAMSGVMEIFNQHVQSMFEK